MNDEKITVRVTQRDKPWTSSFSASVDAIEVVLGEGVHNVRCRLTPTATAWPMRACDGARDRL
jgi:hypothetical protein